MAREKGIRSIVLRDKLVFSEIEKDIAKFNEFSIDPNNAVLNVYNELVSAYQSNSVEQDVGYQLLGPVLSSFCHNLLERLVAQKITSVYFMAREGLVIKGVFDQIRLKYFSDFTIESHYLCVSRLSTFRSCMSGGVQQFLLQGALANVDRYTLSNVFKPFGVSESLLAERSAFHGVGALDADLPEGFHEWQPFLNLVNDVELNDAVSSRGVEDNALFCEYLKQQGFFTTDQVAVVDVGWSGQIQNNIVQALANKKNVPIVHGYYLSLIHI